MTVWDRYQLCSVCGAGIGVACSNLTGVADGAPVKVDRSEPAREAQAARRLRPLRGPVMRGWLRRIDADLSRDIEQALVPHEPSADERTVALNREVARCHEAARQALHAGDRVSMDRWLDMRLELRPPRPEPVVPVIPGRPS